MASLLRFNVPLAGVIVVFMASALLLSLMITEAGVSLSAPSEVTPAKPPSVPDVPDSRSAVKTTALEFELAAVRYENALLKAKVDASGPTPSNMKGGSLEGIRRHDSLLVVPPATPPQFAPPPLPGKSFFDKINPWSAVTNHQTDSDTCLASVPTVTAKILALQKGSIVTGSGKPIPVDGYDECACEKATVTPEVLRATGSHRRLPLPKVSGPADPGLAPPGLGGGRVMLLSHGRIQWLNPHDGTRQVVVHEPGARFRGAFATEFGTLWTLTTPDLAEDSIFVEYAMPSGRKKSHVVAVDSKDAHDMVRVGRLVYVVATRTGDINVYAADGLWLVRRHRIFAETDHINTIGVTTSAIYIMLHNKNRKPSELHVVSRFEDQSFDHYPGIGMSAHGFTIWGPDHFIALDSVGGKVVKVGRLDRAVNPVWSCDTSCFLKGLAVVGDTVIFGRSPPQKRMKRMQVNCTVVAVDLRSGQKLWETPGETIGLLNQVVHPETLDEVVAWPANNDGQWPISLADKIKCKNAKTRGQGKAGQFRPTDDIMTPHVMLGQLDIFKLRARVIKDWDYIWDNQNLQTEQLYSPQLNRLFPGVRHVRLLFSTGEEVAKFNGPDMHTCIVLPGWAALRDDMWPVLNELFGTTRLNIPDWELKMHRLQLNRMPAKSEIQPHRDSGAYATVGHRLHIPLIVPTCVQFQQYVVNPKDEPVTNANPGWRELPFKEGEAFEVNNVVRHTVTQSGPYERVTLIVDINEEPCKQRLQLSSDCPSLAEKWWTDPKCVVDHDVTLDEWRPDSAKNSALVG